MSNLKDKFKEGMTITEGSMSQLIDAVESKDNFEVGYLSIKDTSTGSNLGLSYQKGNHLFSYTITGKITLKEINPGAIISNFMGDEKVRAVFPDPISGNPTATIGTFIESSKVITLPLEASSMGISASFSVPKTTFTNDAELIISDMFIY